jgi:hypothetical protein
MLPARVDGSMSSYVGRTFQCRHLWWCCYFFSINHNLERIETEVVEHHGRCQKHLKTDILVPTPNLTWLQVAVRKFKFLYSCIWNLVGHQIPRSWRTSSAFRWLLTHPYMVNSLRVMISAVWRVLLKFQLWTEWDTWTKLEFEPTSKGKLTEP